MKLLRTLYHSSLLSPAIIMQVKFISKFDTSFASFSAWVDFIFVKPIKFLILLFLALLGKGILDDLDIHFYEPWLECHAC